MTWKLADEWRPSKLLHYGERLEYWEDFWRPEETSCHSNSRGKPSANDDVKSSKGVSNYNNDKQKMQQNSRCKLRGDRNETINHISECKKLAQKEYKTIHDGVGKVIYGEFCNKLNFFYTNKWYMHNPESVREKETHKLHWYFDIETNHVISARPSDIVIIKKKKKKVTNRIVDLAFPADQRVKLKESEEKTKYLDLARELKKLSYIKVTVIPIVIGALSAVTKWLIHGLEDLEIKGREKTIQTTTSLRSARILWIFQETWENMLPLKRQWKPIN